jgi:hypothetical protein
MPGLPGHFFVQVYQTRGNARHRFFSGAFGRLYVQVYTAAKIKNDLNRRMYLPAY